LAHQHTVAEGFNFATDKRLMNKSGVYKRNAELYENTLRDSLSHVKTHAEERLAQFR